MYATVGQQDEFDARAARIKTQIDSLPEHPTLRDVAGNVVQVTRAMAVELLTAGMHSLVESEQ